jgi:hypothetical protein
MTEVRELSISELDAVSGGRITAQSTIGGLTFTRYSDGQTTVSAQNGTGVTSCGCGHALAVNSGGGWQPIP